MQDEIYSVDQSRRIGVAKKQSKAKTNYHLPPKKTCLLEEESDSEDEQKKEQKKEQGNISLYPSTCCAHGQISTIG